jgi:hypothetical protein
MTIEPISPDNVTVLGYKVQPTDKMWTCLDWSDVTYMEKASILVVLLGQENAPIDPHLSVAAVTEHGERLRYRVRPRRDRDRFVQVDGVWALQKHQPKQRNRH